MHMADALLSPAVGLSMWAASAGTIAFSAAKIKREELSEKKLPMMAVAGAFVFAAQMINFTIPGTGSSGHLGGGLLLAVLLGGYPALLTISTVLVIQSLIFADGGLLALGCNIFNMGVIPCLMIYPLIFKPLTRHRFSAKNISLAAVFAALAALQLGALGVVLQTQASGIAELPFGAFLIMMQPIHLAIGLAEGLVTAAILCFVHQMRPEIMNSSHDRSALKKGVSMKIPLIVLAIMTLVVAGGLSLLASANPDGLEWSIEKVAGTSELVAQGGIFDIFSATQKAVAVMPDYEASAAGEISSSGSTAAAGIIGASLTFALAGLAGWVITKAKKKRRASFKP